MSGLNMTATRVTQGATSFNSCTHFPIIGAVVNAEPRDVAAGSREALHKALTDRIGHSYENDRYGACLLPQRRDRRRVACKNCVRRQGDQFRCIGLEERRIARSKAIVDPDILTLDPAQVFQRIRKGRDTCPIDGIVLGKSVQYADAAHPLRKLSVAGERRYHRWTEQRYKPTSA